LRGALRQTQRRRWQARRQTQRWQRL